MQFVLNDNFDIYIRYKPQSGVSAPVQKLSPLHLPERFDINENSNFPDGLVCYYRET